MNVQMAKLSLALKIITQISRKIGGSHSINAGSFFSLFKFLIANQYMNLNIYTVCSILFLFFFTFFFPPKQRQNIRSKGLIGCFWRNRCNFCKMLIYYSFLFFNFKTFNLQRKEKKNNCCFQFMCFFSLFVLNVQ